VILAEVSLETLDPRRNKMRLITFDELREKLANRSRASIYRDIERGQIPKPLKIGRSVYWEETQIREHIKKLLEASND